MKLDSLPIKAILFDFDGTLTRPGAIDFPLIKRTIGCPPDETILEFIDGLDSPDTKARAHAELDRLEMAAAGLSQPNHGAEELVRFIQAQGLPIAILSRNSQASIERALQNFTHLTPADFAFIGSRELPTAPKPSPAGIHHAAEVLGVSAVQMLVVGDFIYDVRAGNAAGATTVFLENGHGDHCVESDYSITLLDELRDIIRLVLPLPAGKLPNDLLADFLGDPPDDPTVLIGPGVGEDTAAVLAGGDDVVVLKSDPITFVSAGIGEFTVVINANDLATAGATPRWFLTTLLFPIGATAYAIRQVMTDLQVVCQKHNISLCGGHTEVTDAVTRAVVSGMLVGTVPRDRLIDKRRMQPGDRVLLTKGVAVEGTAIIAREVPERLRELGLSDAEIDAAAALLDRLSIRDEAKIAAATDGVHALHDITEGGLATAVEEFARAGGCGMRITMEEITIFDVTRRICALLDLDPLGLIGSGSLLICVAPDRADGLIQAIRADGIEVAKIGEVVDGEGVSAVRGGKLFKWPQFASDELTKVLS